MVNKVILVGNLGKDPEVRFTPNGKAVAKFPVATSEKWTDQGGNKQERTEWHNVVVWGKLAENCGQYLAKGRPVFVEGAIRSRQYDDRDGNKRYITEIIAREVKFLRGGNHDGRGDGTEAPTDDGGGYDGAPGDDDIPF